MKKDVNTILADIIGLTYLVLDKVEEEIPHFSREDVKNILSEYFKEFIDTLTDLAMALEENK